MQRRGFVGLISRVLIFKLDAGKGGESEEVWFLVSCSTLLCLSLSMINIHVDASKKSAHFRRVLDFVTALNANI